MKKSALSSVLAFSILIGSFGVAPVTANFASDATQVSEEQEIEWKTYHDYKHGWSINYLSDWEIDRTDPESISFVSKGEISLAVSWAESPFPLHEETFALLLEEMERRARAERNGLRLRSCDA